eukprot:6927970-Prymnesium_polylepis.1
MATRSRRRRLTTSRITSTVSCRPGRLSGGAPGTVEWNYTSFVPHALIVNLGTNDYDIAQFFHEQPSFAHFGASYTNFLNDLIARYQGALPALIIACGPMTSLQCPTVAQVASNISATHPTLK